MEPSKANLRWVFPAIVVATLLALQTTVPVNAQIPISPCTASMLTSFSPCMNFLTNNTANMSTPTPGCCTSIMSLATNGSGCLCQILTGGVPFRVPVNRTLAVSLPRSCNIAGVPVQCNLATSPPASAPAPSSIAQTPALSPAAAPSGSDTPISSSSPAAAPISNTSPTLTPLESPTASTEAPPASTDSPGKASNPATSAAKPSLALSPSLLLLPFALVMMKYY